MADEKLIGFAKLAPEVRKAYARKGSARARELGYNNNWDRDEAKKAGKVGGRKSAEIRKNKKFVKTENN